MHSSLLLRTSSPSLQFCGAVSRRKPALRYAVHFVDVLLTIYVLVPQTRKSLSDSPV